MVCIADTGKADYLVPLLYFFQFPSLYPFWILHYSLSHTTPFCYYYYFLLLATCSSNLSALLSIFTLYAMAQVHETVVGEELAIEEAGEIGENASQTKDEVFVEESVTDDFGMKEYDYSFKDYSEPVPEGETVGDTGHALPAVTREGGVSHVVLSGKFVLTFCF